MKLASGLVAASVSGRLGAAIRERTRLRVRQVLWFPLGRDEFFP